MTFDNYVFRCSQIGKLMTEPRSKSETLSETTKTYLTELFIKEHFGREKELENKYLTKGLECEQDSLSLLSEVRKRFVKKNKRRFKNEWLTGEPDVFNYNGVSNDETFCDIEVEDIKNNWSLFTFIEAEVTKDYDWQLEGYCLISGATQKRLTYTLCNTPAHLIDAEKKRLSYKFDVDSPTFADKCKQLEINSIFDLGLFMKENPDYHFHCNVSEWHYDIPAIQRIKSFEVPRKSESEIKKLYERIAESRKFLNLLSQKFNQK